MIAAGHAYRLQVDFFDPPKPKLLVLAYISQDGRARFFVINSERTELQKSKEELRKHVLSMPRGTHDFLTHDSWLDCSEVVGGWTAAELEEAVSEIPECYLSKLTPQLLADVRKTVSDSRLLSGRDKSLILKQWPNIAQC